MSDPKIFVVEDPKPHRENEATPTFVYFLSFTAVIAGLLFGYDTGVVSGAMLYMRGQLDLTYIWQEYVVSVTLMACALFALIAGPTTDKFGRKPVILASSVIFTAAAVVQAAAPDKYVLLVGRFFVGVAIGLASMTVPAYLAEVCPSRLRGRLIAAFQLFITLGLLIASIVDGAFSYMDPKINWRLMLVIPVIASIIQFVGILFMPESPRWLLAHGKKSEAFEILKRIRSTTNEALTELDQIEESAKEEKNNSVQGFTLWVMLKTSHVRRALLIGCGIQMFQQLCGINTVMYYSASIMEMTGIKDKTFAIWLTCITAGVNFLFTFVGIYLVEKIGRKKLLLASMTGVIASLMILAVGFQVIAMQSPDLQFRYNETFIYEHANLSDTKHRALQCSTYSKCNPCVTNSECGFCFREHSSGNKYGICLPTENSDYSDFGNCTKDHDSTFTWAYNWCPSQIPWIPVLGMVTYLCSFSAGMGPMPWVINSEIYPQWARSTGCALATSSNWLFNLLISMTVLTMFETITVYGSFYIYAGITTIGFIFILFFVPETKGKQLEDVISLFKGNILQLSCS